MKIFRSKADGKLYIISWVRPPKFLGSWYEAHPYGHQGKVKKFYDERDIEKKYDLVSER